MKHDKVHNIYKKITLNQDIEPTLVRPTQQQQIPQHTATNYSTVLSLQAFIQYMKFARRAEGIKAARSVFKLAREDARTSHHVYVAAALMEYFCSKVRSRLFWPIFKLKV